MAQLYKADVTIEEFPEPANGTDYSLEEMRAAIGGGWIETVQTKDGRVMVVDEEGKLKGFPRNEAATALYRYGDQDPIVGDALVFAEGQIR